MSDLIPARHTITGIVADYPQNIIDHEVLGQYLEVVSLDSDGNVIEEDEDDKVVIDKRVYTKRNTNEESSVTSTSTKAVSE